MFSNIAKFFIQNSKLTIVIIIVILISGLWSYIVLPKQYNPTIVVPAFNIFIEANWLKSSEISKLVVTPLENKLMEIEGIDEVYWLSGDNYAWVMVKFRVGEDLENAKIRLNQKINENMNLKPLWVSEPIITTINPEELPQITFAISYIWSELKEEDSYIYLRQISNLLKEKIKTIKNVTTLEIVGWYNKDIIVELDLQAIEARNTDLMQVYSALKNNNLNLYTWDIKSDEKVWVFVNAKVENIKDIESIVISNNFWNILYLKDVASIRYWIKKIDNISTFDNKITTFLWVWKATWTNSVFLTKDVLSVVSDLEKTLPKDIKISVIQDEWKTAENATNMLLVNLAQSIIIVFLVLALYLGKKDAFNTAVSIPLSLWLVFLLALMFWENINRITLFALILVLWMLVDNSTVVVENISRHLNDRINTWKTKLEAVLEATQEVWVGVILSTLSRLLAFGAMFAVWWMMWEYMWPIPKFAIMALVVSVFIAFAINPWISYIWAKDVNESDRNNHEIKKISKFDIRIIYLSFMKYFLNTEKKSSKRRFVFKLVFWLSLFAVILWPIYLWIFKARMLPKSNQNQVYVWIDAPRWWSARKMLEVEKDLVYFLKNKNKSLDKELDIVQDVSVTIWQAFMWDFANLFRGWLSRVWENQLSARVNLVPSDIYKEKTGEKRIFSENYTIEIRPLLREYFLKKYPDLKIRLLEDPPGPPVRATFLMKIKSSADTQSRVSFLQKVENEVRKISKEQSIVDLWNSLSTTYRKLEVKLDLEAVSRAMLTSNQVANTLAIALNWTDISLIWSSSSLEATNLVLAVKNEQIETLDLLKTISFTNPNGNKIFLDTISKIDYSFVWDEINTDRREVSDYIYAEMWNNSLVYPAIKLFGILKSEEFLWNEYELISWNPYSLTYKWYRDWQIYKIEWSWEWELTIDTFRDLWIAMWLSLLVIYFLLVWQFSSFRIAGIIMITFLLSFFWVFPGFTLLYLLKNEYFSATSMIWIIALGWIVVWNAIILLDYLNVLKRNGLTIIDALLKAWYVRFAPIVLTSLTTVFWAATIIWDPVWSWLAWSIIWWLFVSSVLTLVVIPIFYYDSQKDEWEKCAWKDEKTC